MSYSRYRKRDKSEIDRKEELGLGKVENIDLTEITETVLQSTQDYLNSPVYYPIESKSGAIGIVKFTGTGKALFTTTLCKTSTTYNSTSQKNEVTMEPIDIISGSIIYTKPEIDSSGSIGKCPVTLDIQGDTENSVLFLESKIQVICVSEQQSSGEPAIVTYVGINLDGLSPLNISTHVATNLHDYSPGSVDYCTEYIPTKGVTEPWSFKTSDCIMNRALAIPVYERLTGNLVNVTEGDDLDSRELDIASINGVPFSGAYKVTVDGESSRNITVSAKHASSSLEDSGEHSWEVISDYPVVNYVFSRKGTGEKIESDKIILEKDEADKDLYGLCSLSSFDSSATDIPSLIDSLGYYDPLKGGAKDVVKSRSSVVTVDILEKFWYLLNSQIKSGISGVDNKVERLMATLNGKVTGFNPSNLSTITVPAATVTKNRVSLTLDYGSDTFESPGTYSKTLKPIGQLLKDKSDGQTETGDYTTKIKYDWGHTDSDLKVTFNGEDLTEGTYSKTSSGISLDGTKLLVVSIKDPVEAKSFVDRYVIFTTETQVSGVTVYGKTAFKLTYKNNNEVSEGILIDKTLSKCCILPSGVSAGAVFYPLGDNIEFEMSYDDYIDAGKKFTVYMNQVKRSGSSFLNTTVYSVGSNNGTVEMIDNPIEADPVYEIIKLTDDLVDPGIEGYTNRYLITYGEGEDAKKLALVDLKVGPKSSDISIDKSELYFGSAGTAEYTVTLESDYPVSVSSGYSDWISCVKQTDKRFLIKASPWSSATNSRSSYIEFVNQAGSSVKCKVIQDAEPLYMYLTREVSIRPPRGASAPPVRSTAKYSPGDTITYRSTTSSSEVISFKVYSNTNFTITTSTGGVIKSTETYTSTGSSGTQIRITIDENQSTRAVVNCIKISSTTLGTINYQVLKAGSTDTLECLPPGDLTFSAENSFDPLRSEKIITVTCNSPEDIQLSTSSSSGNLVAKIYDITDKTAKIHCYPKSCKLIPRDTKETLNISYNGQSESVEFTFKSNIDTVGSYFNVSSTILTFTKSSSQQTKYLTAFCMSGILKLESTTSDVTIGTSEVVTVGSGYKYYKFPVTISAGKSPVSKTPWVLKLTSSLSSGKVIYVNIYESSDVSISPIMDIQVTAFGYPVLPDGCEAIPIVYQRHQLRSYIGTNKAPNSSAETIEFFTIGHDTSGLSITGGNDNNYWSLANGVLSYKTCNNCGTISDNYHNMITLTRGGRMTSVISNSLDIEPYCVSGTPNTQYDSVYGGIGIDTSIVNTTTEFPLLPSTACTIPPVVLGCATPSLYYTDGSSVKYLLTPPDWKITSSISGTTSFGGYLSIPSGTGNISYSVTSQTPTGTSTTTPDCGKYTITFSRSKLSVISEKSVVGEGSVIFDFQNLNAGFFACRPIPTIGSDGKYTRYNSSLTTAAIQGIQNRNLNAVTGSNLTYRISSEWQYQMSNLGQGWSNSSTSGNLHNSLNWSTAMFYDIENHEVLEKSSQSPYVGMYSLKRTAKVAQYLHGQNPLTVNTGSLGYNISIYTGLASIAYPTTTSTTTTVASTLPTLSTSGLTLSSGTALSSSNTLTATSYTNTLTAIRLGGTTTTASSAVQVFTPFVTITGTNSSGETRTTNYILFKANTKFGIGYTSKNDTSSTPAFDLKVTEDRKVVGGKIYYGSINYKSMGTIVSGVSPSGWKTTFPANIMLPDDLAKDYPVSQDLDMTIGPSDFSKLIDSYFKTNYNKTLNPGLGMAYKWFFMSTENTCLDKTMKFAIPPASRLTDLKITVVK